MTQFARFLTHCRGTCPDMDCPPVTSCRGRFPLESLGFSPLPHSLTNVTSPYTATTSQAAHRRPRRIRGATSALSCAASRSSCLGPGVRGRTRWNRRSSGIARRPATPTAGSRASCASRTDPPPTPDGGCAVSPRPSSGHATRAGSRAGDGKTPGGPVEEVIARANAPWQPCLDLLAAAPPALRGTRWPGGARTPRVPVVAPRQLPKPALAHRSTLRHALQEHREPAEPGLHHVARNRLFGADRGSREKNVGKPGSTEEERMSGCGWVLRCSWDNGF